MPHCLRHKKNWQSIYRSTKYILKFSMTHFRWQNFPVKKFIWHTSRCKNCFPPLFSGWQILSSSIIFPRWHFSPQSLLTLAQLFVRWPLTTKKSKPTAQNNFQKLKKWFYFSPLLTRLSCRTQSCSLQTEKQRGITLAQNQFGLTWLLHHYFSILHLFRRTSKHVLIPKLLLARERYAQFKTTPWANQK